MINHNTDTLSVFTILLGLSDIQVTEIRNSTDDRTVTLVVICTKESLACRICGKSTRGNGLGRKIKLRHLSLLGKETYIEITPRRGLCDHCDDGPSTTEKLDWYEPNSRMTKPFEQHLLFELINSTVADVSRKENVDYHAVDNLLNRYIETKADFSKIKSLGILGLDEISLKKGHQDFVTLITYRIYDKVHILGVVKGREKYKIVEFLRSIPRVLRNTVQAVCCDLYDGYMNACKEFFKNKVPVVADRFHVQKLYRKSLVSMRKSELKRLRRELTEKEYARLKPAIAMLRKQKDYFTDDEKVVVEELFKLSPKLKLAYKFSRKLSGIFDSHITSDEGKEKMVEWIELVKRSELSCFNKFMVTLAKNQEQIANYFIQRNSSGFVEGYSGPLCQDSH
jgi:transposase